MASGRRRHRRIARGGGTIDRIDGELTGAVALGARAAFGFTPGDGYTLSRLGYDGSQRVIAGDVERQGVRITTSSDALFWFDWTSECLTWTSHGKSTECVEYDNELRLSIVAQ